jgi:conjugal transfer/entry exclusion protein
MQWWGALTQQFQSIAANALKDAGGQAALDAGQQMATAFTQEALKTASGVVAQTTAMARPAKKATPAKPAAGAKATAQPKAAARPKAPKSATQPPAKAARKPASPARPR